MHTDILIEKSKQGEITKTFDYIDVNVLCPTLAVEERAWCI